MNKYITTYVDTSNCVDDVAFSFAVNKKEAKL
jgi:hypothetical protein